MTAPADTVASLPVVRNLRATTPVAGSEWIGGVNEARTVQLVNPDGPEAAELITELVEVLGELHRETLRTMKRPVATSGPGKVLFDKVEAVLAKAREGAAQ